MEAKFWVVLVTIAIAFVVVVNGDEAVKPLVKVVKGKKVCTKGWECKVWSSHCCNETISEYFESYQFENLFSKRNSPVAHAVGFWDYHSFITASADYQHLGFGTTGGKLTGMKEVAAFLGHVGSKTSCGYGVATGGPLAWGLCYNKEMSPSQLYCDDYYKLTYPCSPGASYHGRGALPLYWNYNYGETGEALKVDLLNHPEYIEQNATLAFQAAIWRWITPVKKHQPGANLTISFAGELLQNAEELIRMGLHPSEIISGYNKAITKTIEVLDELVEKGSEKMDVRNKDEVISRMKAAVASKQFGQEDILSSHIADACIQVCPKNPANFNVDNVRVAKIVGGGLHNITVVQGMVLRNDAVGTIKRVEKAKVVVFVGGVDTSATETKGTVLIHSAEQLENYAKTEEAKVEELIKAVADSGAKVIVSGAAVGEMALHFCERYKLMVLKISSKFELRRFCRTTGAVAILKLSHPNPDDLGYVDSVSVEEIGGARVTVVKNEQGGNSISTILLRGSTDSILDDLERAVDDGVNTYKAMCRDSRIVPGAAATEIELAKRVKEFSFKETGLDQYAIAKFAESFEMVPKTLAENAGLNAMEIISSLYAEHASGNAKVGIDLEEGACKDVSPLNVWDLHVTKFFALKYAADAACTVLRVDQIIMAKPAGGPRRDQQPAGAGMDED